MEELREYLKKVDDIDTYINILYKIKDHVIIVLSVKDTPGSNMSEEVLNKIKGMGFSNFSKELWRMYAGILYNGEPVLDSQSNTVEENVEAHIEVDNTKISVLSAAWRNGNRTSILINNIDYACNRRGVNIVVYDTATDAPIDSIFYDSHGETPFFSREKRILEKQRWLENKQVYDVCVVGFWYGANYGSILNGYATYRILKNLGKSVILLGKPDYETDDMELRAWTHNMKFMNSVYSKDEIVPRMSFDDMSLINKHAYTFLAGSDQIWNYRVSFSGCMYLPFVKEEKRRISFCSSFGSINDHVPNERQKFVSEEFHKYDAISVREEFGKENLKNKYGIDAKVLLEPVFDIEKEIYYELIEQATFYENEPYIIAYILDPNDEKLAVINKIGYCMGCKVITIPDGYYTIIKSSWDKYQRKGEFPNVQVNMDVTDFLKAFSDAQFVVTDSFHGTCFSIIFEKKFISVCNNLRGAERFDDSLGRFNLVDRLVCDIGKFQWNDNYLDDIDYESINKVIERGRNEAVEWLSKAVNINKCNLSVKRTVNFNECIGCAACANICPKNAIEMSTDKYGYYIPKVLAEKCINCGACTKVCPTLCIRENPNNVPKLYEFQSMNSEVLYASSSGGIFTTLAEKIFDKNGVIYGAAWDDNFYVKHTKIESIAEIEKLQKSKYLQSFIDENTFKDIKIYLQEGRLVMFTGCPCQVAGLRNFLGREYENLVLVDLLCGNAPSAKFFQKYLQDDVHGEIEKYEFRSKEHGWNCVCEKITYKTMDKEIRYGQKCDEYQRVYHNHTMCAEHCEHCKYQVFPRLGDITIGDFWWIDKHDSLIDTQKGVSAVLINNDKGNGWFNRISDCEGIKKEAPLEWLSGNGNYKGNWAGAQRDLFYEMILKKGFHEAADYALKPNHGNYRNIYHCNDTLLQYDRVSYQFAYDPMWWEQHVIDGCLTLIVKPGASKPGRYAVMQLGKELERKYSYRFSVRYKIKSESDVINFHIKDSGSSLYQIILSDNIKGKNNGLEWIEKSVEFVPKSNFYDEFMIGASQVSGNNNYISFAYISIVKIR